MNHHILNSTFVAICILLTSLQSYGVDASKRGLEIAKALDQMDVGFHDQKVNMKMILRDRHNRESSRTIRSQTFEVADDGDKTLIAFVLLLG